MEELKFSLQDSDERCPKINFYSYSMVPTKYESKTDYKRKDYYNFHVYGNQTGGGII